MSFDQTKQAPACRYCGFYESRSETRHLGLGHCQRLQITVVAAAAPCGSFAPKRSSLAGLDYLCSNNGHGNLCIYVLTNSRDDVLAHVLGTALAPCDVNMRAIQSMGCSLLLVARGAEVVQYATHFMDKLVLSDEFWTCSCPGDCIRHVGMRPCPLCGEREHSGRSKTLKEVLREEQGRQWR